MLKIHTRAEGPPAKGRATRPYHGPATPHHAHHSSHISPSHNDNATERRLLDHIKAHHWCLLASLNFRRTLRSRGQSGAQRCSKSIRKPLNTNRIDSTRRTTPL
ncbi:hypothetical protein E2C01_019243 [Portunus trituberculatus]|uniref:Uncharacterized protein n=1 Tax=Portunus trituberculatus TaxID=210409 RepID=A0A5B7DWR6_PORTR|nr:hypothetical protein [Portunus trituberculatus]